MDYFLNIIFDLFLFNLICMYLNYISLIQDYLIETNVSQKIQKYFKATKVSEACNN